MAYQKEPGDFRVLYGKNLYFKLHFHPQCEIVYCKSGHIQLIIEENEYLIRENECAVVFPNLSHGYRRYEKNEMSEAYLVIVPVNYVEDFKTELDAAYPVNPVLAKEQLPEFFEEIIVKLFEAFSDSTHNIRLYKAFSGMLLAYTIPRFKLKSAVSSYDMELTPRILNYISCNLTNDMTLENVSKTFGISKNTLSEIFTKELHTTYVVHINSVRIEAAKKLLKKTNHSISAIAFESGFKSERSFFRVFKDTMKCSPAQYRKQHKTARK